VEIIKIANEIKKEIEIKNLKKRVESLEGKNRPKTLFEKEWIKEKEKFLNEY
jgi:hypothetical protein